MSKGMSTSIQSHGNLQVVIVEILDTQQMSTEEEMVSPMLLPSLIIIVIIAIRMDIKHMNLDLISINHIRSMHPMDIVILTTNSNASLKIGNHRRNLIVHKERKSL